MRILLATAAGLALGFAGVVIGASSAAQQVGQTSIGSKMSLPPGYLPQVTLPNSLALLPAPPAPGSASFARDEEAHARAAPFRNGPRWTLAARMMAAATVARLHADAAFAVDLAAARAEVAGITQLTSLPATCAAEAAALAAGP